MALYTKKLIMSTFQEMLEELPFDKITVAALVKAGGYQPQYILLSLSGYLCFAGCLVSGKGRSIYPQ